MHNKLIYIVGHIRLLNALLAAFLKEKTGAACHVVESLDGIPERKDENQSESRLILLDCLGKTLQILMMEFDANAVHASAGDFIALFNVPPRLGIEKSMISRGVHGFFYKWDTEESFVKGVSAIFNGELWISRKVLTDCILKTDRGTHPMPAGRLATLTPREVEILAEVASGASNQAIADKLSVSPYTVKTHLHNIFKKINVPNRLQAALWAAENF